MSNILTYLCLTAGTSVEFISDPSFQMTLDRLARSRNVGRAFSGGTYHVDVVTAQRLVCQSAGVGQFIERVVTTSTLAVLLGQQREHVAFHRQDVADVDPPRRFLRLLALVVLAGRRGRRRWGGGRAGVVHAAVVGRVRLDVAVDVGQKQPLVGSRTQRGYDQRFQRLTISTGFTADRDVTTARFTTATAAIRRRQRVNAVHIELHLIKLHFSSTYCQNTHTRLICYFAQKTYSTTSTTRTSSEDVRRHRAAFLYERRGSPHP